MLSGTRKPVVAKLLTKSQLHTHNNQTTHLSGRNTQISPMLPLSLRLAVKSGNSSPALWTGHQSVSPSTATIVH